MNDPTTKRPTSRYGALRDPRIEDLPALPESGPRKLTLTSSGIYIAVGPWEIFATCLEQTDVWALRSCPICHVPFLPAREDQNACSLQHANTLRVRRKRGDQNKTVEWRWR